MDYWNQLPFYSWFVFNAKKSKESELTELIKLILLKHDRVKKKKMKLSYCANTFTPAITGARTEEKPLDNYRNSAHTWMCTCISWQESAVVLEMLFSWCDGMLRAPCLLLDTRAKQYTLPQLESISLQEPNTQSLRGQFLTHQTFVPCTEGSLGFVFWCPDQTANSLRSKLSSNGPRILLCSVHLLVG